ncbi:MAG: YybS family protein [Thermodesulfobacteriota bacterium]|nr:YybS family protein [Thermodesulfobacteriota bacterium]
MFKDLKEDYKRDILNGVIITILFFLAFVIIPFLGIIISVFVPLPILFYHQKLGRVLCIFITLIALTIAICFLGPSQGALEIFLLIELGVIGLVFSDILQRNLSIEKTVAYSVFIILGVGAILVYLYSSIKMVNPWHFVVQQINESVNQAVRLYQGLGMSAEQRELFKKDVADFLIRAFPSFIVVGTVLIVWMNLLLAKALNKTGKIRLPEFGDLSTWQAPDILVWGVILGGLLLLSKGLTISSIGLNMLIICLCVFFFQGIAIVSYFFHKKNIPFFLRTLGYMLIVIQQLFMLIVIGVGLFDVWADFRRLKNRGYQI